MLEHVDLRHFKCFETLKLPLRPLTLLSGANASGKSSVMQALALLHQTMREHEWSSRLMLNGTAIRLGTTLDVVDQVHGGHGFGITLQDANAARFVWDFEGERDEMSVAVRRARVETRDGDVCEADVSQPLRYLLPDRFSEHPLTGRLRGLTYLTAERLGPQELYPLDDPQLAPVVGPRGEHTVSVLYSGGNLPVLEGLAVPDVTPTRSRQVESRMAGFFPGCVLEIEHVPRTNSVTLGIRTSNDTEFLRPVHTGFGLTQVLPIVVAAVSAKQDDLLLIENPEVHLHPSGQAAMGRFLAEVASAGVQVVVETHSDHVLNGIRRAVKDRLLGSDGVAVHYFHPRGHDGSGGEPQVLSPILDGDGNIDNWPDGFFDQFDKDMDYFAGWS